MFNKKIKDAKVTWNAARRDGASLLVMLLIVLIPIALLVGLVLFVHWIAWLIWVAVVPAIFTTWPASIANPGYWTFTGFIILVRWVFTSIFRRKTND